MKQFSSLPKQSLCAPWSIFHTYNVFTAGCPFSFGGICEYACPNHRPGFQTRNSRPCPFPPTSIRTTLINLAPAIWYCHSGSPSFLGCTPLQMAIQTDLFWAVTWMDISPGVENFVSDKKDIHRRQSGSILYLLMLEEKAKVVLQIGIQLPQSNWWLLREFCKV